MLLFIELAVIFVFSNIEFSGYHLVQDPSMRQLHPHVISQDFDSTHLKNKKHWNSFNTAFFRDSMDAAEEVTSDGKAKLKDDDNLLSMELRCH
ncbi:hypothetical protein ACFX2J_009853 [Malus domestica]